MTAVATGVTRDIAARIRREKSETGRLSSPTRAKTEPYTYLYSFDKAATLAGDLSSPVSVETPRKLMKQLGYCWKKACDDSKVLVKRQKYFSTANRVLCMPERV